MTNEKTVSLEEMNKKIQEDKKPFSYADFYNQEDRDGQLILTTPKTEEEIMEMISSFDKRSQDTILSLLQSADQFKNNMLNLQKDCQRYSNAFLAMEHTIKSVS